MGVSVPVFVYSRYDICALRKCPSPQTVTCEISCVRSGWSYAKLGYDKKKYGRLTMLYTYEESPSEGNLNNPCFESVLQHQTFMILTFIFSPLVCAPIFFSLGLCCQVLDCIKGHNDPDFSRGATVFRISILPCAFSFMDSPT